MQFEPNLVVILGLLSPIVAVILGWWILNQKLTPAQLIGIGMVFIAVWFAQANMNQRKASTRLTSKKNIGSR